MTEPEWHGWSVKDALVRKEHQPPSLHVGRLPGMKSVQLYSMDGNVVCVLASFRSEARAKIAMDMIDQLARLGRYALEDAKR